MASVSGFSEAEESSKARKARQKVSMSNSEGSPQMEVDDKVDVCDPKKSRNLTYHGIRPKPVCKHHALPILVKFIVKLK